MPQLAAAAFYCKLSQSLGAWWVACIVCVCVCVHLCLLCVCVCVCVCGCVRGGGGECALWCGGWAESGGREQERGAGGQPTSLTDCHWGPEREVCVCVCVCV